MLKSTSGESVISKENKYNIENKLLDSPVPATLPELKEKRPIRVKSLDFDGCIFNDDYMGYHLAKRYEEFSDIPQFDDETNPLFTTNKVFFDHVKKEYSENPYAKLILLVGSARQSEEIDIQNCSDFRGRIRSEFCFSAIKLIKDRISRDIEAKCELDKFLTADIFNDEKPGTHFDRAVANHHLVNWKYKPKTVAMISDTRKLILLYAQIHKIASEHPEEPIIFDFYDDKVKDILKYMHDNVFSLYPDILPKNVTINFIGYYNGQFPSTKFKPLQGTGDIDFNYKENIQLLMQYALGEDAKPSLKDYDDEFDIGELMYQKGEDTLKDFLKARQLNKKTVDSIETHHQSILPKTVTTVPDSRMEVPTTVATSSTSGLFKPVVTSSAQDTSVSIPVLPEPTTTTVADSRVEVTTTIDTPSTSGLFKPVITSSAQDTSVSIPVLPEPTTTTVADSRVEVTTTIATPSTSGLFKPVVTSSAQDTSVSISVLPEPTTMGPDSPVGVTMTVATSTDRLFKSDVISGAEDPSISLPIRTKKNSCLIL